MVWLNGRQESNASPSGTGAWPPLIGGWRLEASSLATVFEGGCHRAASKGDLARWVVGRF